MEKQKEQGNIPAEEKKNSGFGVYANKKKKNCINFVKILYKKIKIRA